MNEFRIYLVQEAYSEDQGNEQTLESLLPQLTLGEVLLEENEIEALNWQTQRLIVTRAATARLITNWADFARNEEDVFPQGKYAEVESNFFIMALGERRVMGGVIAGMMTLYRPPAYPLLYPGQPLIQEGRLVLEGVLKVM